MALFVILEIKYNPDFSSGESIILIPLISYSRIFDWRVKYLLSKIL